MYIYIHIYIYKYMCVYLLFTLSIQQQYNETIHSCLCFQNQKRGHSNARPAFNDMTSLRAFVRKFLDHFFHDIHQNLEGFHHADGMRLNRKMMRYLSQSRYARIRRGLVLGGGTSAAAGRNSDDGSRRLLSERLGQIGLGRLAQLRQFSLSKRQISPVQS